MFAKGQTPWFPDVCDRMPFTSVWVDITGIQRQHHGSPEKLLTETLTSARLISHVLVNLRAMKKPLSV